MLNKFSFWLSTICLGCVCNLGCDSTSELDGHADISEGYTHSDIDNIPMCTPIKPSGACDVSTAEGCRDETEICRCEPLCGPYEPPLEETHRWRCKLLPSPNPEGCRDASFVVNGPCNPDGLSCVVWYGDCDARQGFDCIDGKWGGWGVQK